jgi:hypothetical protein
VRVTDETKKPDQPAEPQPGDPTEESGPPAAREKPPETPIFVSPRSSKKWQGDGGLSRWTTWGCIVGIMILIAMLVFGVVITKKTAWITFERSQRRVLSASEGHNDPPERLRTSRNLERFAVQLRVARDPYPEMGEFFKMVRVGFEDGTLTTDELEEINRFLESKLPAGAGHGMLE